MRFEGLQHWREQTRYDFREHTMQKDINSRLVIGLVQQLQK